MGGPAKGDQSVTDKRRNAPNEIAAAVERENEATVLRYIEGWTTKDADKIISCLHDDIAYMVYEGGPTHEGKDKIHEVVTAFFKNWKKIEFDVKRMSIMGNVTMHERAEDYHGVEGQEDWHFHVTSLLVFKDGKIIIWRDYSTPGERQESPGAGPPN